MSSDSPKTSPAISPKASKSDNPSEQPNADKPNVNQLEKVTSTGSLAISSKASKSVDQSVQLDANNSKINQPEKVTSRGPFSKNEKKILTPLPSPVFISNRIPIKTTQKRRLAKKKLARLQRLKANGIVLARASPYDPFANREMSHPNSNLRSLANLVKASLGTGLLAMPLAMSNAGYAVGFVMTILISCICTHCVHIFVLVSRGVCKIEEIPKLGYAETCEACFRNGPYCIRRFSDLAGRSAKCALFCTYFGGCCIYTVLIIDSVKQIFDEYFFSSPVSTLYYGLAVLVPLCMLVQIKELKYLAPISMISNILLIVVFATCFFYIFRNIEELGFKGKQAFGKAQRFPSYLSTVIFAMEGIGVVMPVENQMRYPSDFLGCPGVLNYSMIIVTCLYMLLGLFGYLKYGKDVQPSVTLNLPMDEWPAVVAKISIALSIMFSYPLHFFVLYKAAVKCIHAQLSLKHPNIQHALIKIAIVCICGAVGISIPMLEQVIGLVGALFYSMLGLIIPASVDLVFHAQDYGENNLILWKDLFLLLFGLTALVTGTIVAVGDIIDHYD